MISMIQDSRHLNKIVQYGEFWYAYERVSTGGKTWGNSCFHTPMGNSEPYKTRKDAEKAAQKHYENA